MGGLIQRYEFTATSSGITFVEGQSAPIDIGSVGLTPHVITGGSPPLTAISNVRIATTSGTGDLSFNLAGSDFSWSADGTEIIRNSSSFGTVTQGAGFLNISYSIILPTETGDLQGNVPFTLTNLADLLSRIEYFTSSNAPGTSVGIQYTFSGAYPYNQPSITLNIAEFDTLPTFTATGTNANLGSVAAGVTSAAFSVASFRPAIVDNDGPGTGIAITATNAASAGTWQYSIDNGQHWTDIGTVGTSAALVLRDSDLIRFAGNAQSAADATFTYRPWDQYGTQAGSKVDTGGNFGIGIATYASTATLHVQDVNDAPVLTPSAPVLTAITEDDIGNAGHTVASFVSAHITDTDANPLKGIAITGFVEANGHWQYSLDGGATWATIGSVSASSALLLRDTDLIRFNPDGRNGTDASLTYRAWDQTSGTAGDKVDSGAGGGASAFSTASDTATLHSQSVNDIATVTVAPVSVMESDGVALDLFFIGDQVTMTDPDFDPSGVNYVAGSASVTATGPTPPFGVLANYIHIDAPSGAVSYDRAAFHWLAPGQSAVYTITFQVQPFNEAPHQETLTFTVSGANDAPVLFPVHSAMAAITEDAVSPAGQTVASLRGPIQDNDPGSLAGIAITATTGNGDWQYSVDNSASWHSFTASDAAALLLRDEDLVRLAPDGKNGGPASFTYQAWDQTSGSAGHTADVTVNGAGTAFSRASDTVTLSVTSINDAPVLVAAHTTLQPLTEDQPGNTGQTVASFLGGAISDVDNGAVQGIALTGATSGNGHWEYSLNIGSSWTSVGTVGEGMALLLKGDDWMRFVPDGKNGTSATLTYHAWDQTSGTHGQSVDLTATGGITAFSIATDTVSIAVSDVNDAPTVSGPVTLTAVNEDTPRVITQAELLANASDVDTAHTLSVANLHASTGTLTDHHDGTWTFTPAQDDDTSVTFTYDVSDGIAAPLSATATLDLLPVNDAPVLVAAHTSLQPITEDQAGNAGQTVASFLGGAISDGDNGAVQGIALTGTTSGNGHWEYSLNGGLSWLSVGTVGEGTALLLKSDDVMRFVPDGKNGTSAALTYHAWDQTSGAHGASVDLTVSGATAGATAFSTGTDTVSIAISDVNDAPTVSGPIALTAVNEDTPRLITQTELLANASDVDTAHTLSVANLHASSGTLTDHHDGTWTFTPVQDDDTSVTFTYEVSDGIALPVAASATLDLLPLNDAPVALDATTHGNEDTQISGSVAVTDVDNTANQLTYALIGQNGGAQHGTVTLGANGSYTYTPDLDYSGSDSFTFKANDGALDSNVATVAITVDPVDDPPVISGPVTLSAVNEDTPRLITQVELLANAHDVDTVHALNIVNLHASSGTLTSNPDGTWTYAPAQDDDTSVTFSYEVSDGTTAVPASATLDLLPVNDAPVAQNGTAQGNEDTPISGSVTVTDVDNTANQLTYALVGQSGGAQHGTVTLGANGSYTYTPDLDYSGSDSFSFKANDGALDSNVATVSITVDPVDDLPVITTGTPLAVAENQTLVAALGATDVDGPNAATYSVTGGADAALFDILGGNLVFRSPRDYEADAHTYQVEITAFDGVDSSTKLLTVDLTDVNDNAPVFASNTSAPDIVPENTQGTVFAAAATDVDGGTTIAYALSGDDAALFTVDPVTGKVHFVTAPDYEAPKDHDHDNNYQVTVHANDGVHDATQDVTVTVTNINEAPVASNGSASGETPIKGHLVATDVDSPSLSYAMVSGPSHGTLSLNADGTFSYAADLNYRGADTFTFKANDGSLDSNVATFNLNVTQLHLAGTAGNDSVTPDGGNERIDGGAGVNTVTFGFKLTDAAISFSGNQIVVDGPNGSHTVLTDFTIFKFADGTVDNTQGNPLVDKLYYYAQNHDVWNAHADAEQHYLTIGWKEGRNPDALFDVKGYLAHNPDVAAAGVNPLLHYDQFGWQEGRDPSMNFDTKAYLAANPDIAAAHVDPLAHFLQYGLHEGRTAFADGHF